MTCKVSHGNACLPVTALHTIDLSYATLLLSNEGSSLCARYTRDGKVVGRWTVFRSQIIHGIASCLHHRNDDFTEYILVIWGGRMLRICSIKSQNSAARDHEGNISLQLRPAIIISDWVMTVAINEEQLNALILTAHNALWSLNLAPHTDCVISHPPSLVGQGMRTLLYSACIVVINDDRILIASGTVFGEVIVWLCLGSTGQWKTLQRHVLLGHQGSIFGVTMSDLIFSQAGPHRLLASCSDDRTIRIWDISDCDSVISGPEVAEFTSTDTGFGSPKEQTLHLAMAWAHASRIWGVHFMPDSADLSAIPDLVSRGEDGVCQFWKLDLRILNKETKLLEVALDPIRHDRHHSGKNAWSLSIDSQMKRTEILTGGADGQIVSRHSPKENDTATGMIQYTDMFRSIKGASVRFLKHYVVFTNGSVLTTTNSGHLLRSRGHVPKAWEVVYAPPKATVTVLCSNATEHLTFYCLDDGRLCVYDIRDDLPMSVAALLISQVTWMQIAYYDEQSAETYTVYLTATLRKEQGSTLIIIEKTGAGIHVRQLKLHLPVDFVLTSSLYCHQRDILVCGSRVGALTIISSVSSTSRQSFEGHMIRHVHGSDQVTSITFLPEPENLTLIDTLHILTTGRDGTFVILQLRVSGNDTTCIVVHRSSPPFGPHIEGAFILRDEERKHRLAMYGFRSKDFIVWDESSQLRLLSIDCGGAYRSWGYSNSNEGSGLFIWTRAGTLNYNKSTQSLAQSLQQGGHGREIKATAIAPVPFCGNSVKPDEDTSRLLATGAEDTEIRLSRYTSESFTSVAVLKHHMTGIQALQFSPCGSYLFSSGGVEEFLVWRLNQVPLLDIGVVMVGVLEKNEEDSDARIMDFDIVVQSSDDPLTATFVILMACSNGKAKVFEFQHLKSTMRGHFKLLQVLNIGTLCLTQACLLREEERLSMLVGSTDGYVRFADMDAAKEAVLSHRVHQSSIAAMVVRKLRAHIHLIASGGDDNGLGVTVVCAGGASPTFETIFIPKAHSAALTAIAFVEDGDHVIGEDVFIVSAGNDQVIRLWRVSGLDMDMDNTGATSVSNDHVKRMSLSVAGVTEVCQYPTDVADVSSMEMVDHGIHNSVHRFDVLVAGVGIQSLKFEIAV